MKKIILSFFLVLGICLVLQNVLAECNYINLSNEIHSCGQKDSICPENFKDSSGNSPVCSGVCADLDCQGVGPFMLDFPKNNSVTNLTPYFNWTVSEGATSYHIYIDNESSFTPPYKFLRNVGSNNYFTLPLNILEPSKTYFWKVVAVNSVGQITASNAPFRFTPTIPQELPCKITSASIIKFCGDDNICNDSEIIQMKITVESAAIKCPNIKKMIIKNFKDIGEETSTITGAIIINPDSECYPVLINETPKITGNVILGNWSVVVSENCAGKEVGLNTALLYNSSNILIGLKSGLFGTIKFADKPSPPVECTCESNGVETQCGSCETSSPYRYCKKNINNEGFWLEDCTYYPIDCCQIRQGYSCYQSSTPGTCKKTVTIEECNTKGKANNTICHTLNGCYWDKPIGLPGEDPYKTFCKHCFLQEQGPETCSDYHNQTACEADRCSVANYECSGTNCKCKWEGSGSAAHCIQTYETQGPSGSDECCSCSSTYGTCDQGCPNQENSRLKTTTCTKCDPSNQQQTCSIQPPNECIACSFRTNKFPFFMPWQILIVLALLSAYYILMIKKKKK